VRSFHPASGVKIKFKIFSFLNAVFQVDPPIWDPTVNLVVSTLIMQGKSRFSVTRLLLKLGA
jgi:hypothetical protein